MTMTNQEKQERFRRKEYLKKIANEIFRDWQFLSARDFPRDPKDVRAKLDKIAELPSGWTDEDFNQAIKAFNTFKIELYSRNPYLFQNDIYAGRSSVCSPEKRLSVQFVREANNAVAQSKKLISHLNSAMNLMDSCPSDKAAVVVEMARAVGLSLLNERIVARSNAATLCLLTTNPVHPKPEWFIEELAKLLREQLSEDSMRQLIERTTLEKQRFYNP